MPSTSHYRLRSRGKSPHLDPAIYWAARNIFIYQKLKIPGGEEFSETAKQRNCELYENWGTLYWWWQMICVLLMYDRIYLSKHFKYLRQ
jgi:hypothetical protein